MLQNEVISSFHQAGEPGVTQAPLGPDLRYIGKLPILNKINNFEEEYLLKGDKIVNRQYGMDEDSIPCYRETIEYRTKNDFKNYYELQYYEYDLRPENQDVIVDGNVMKINLHTKLENLSTTSGIIRRRYDLYFVKDSNTKELFSSKIVESRVIEVNDNNHAGGRRQVEIIKHSSTPVPPSPLPDNVYFENGVFNPIWVGDNFDYTDSDIVRGSYWDVQYDAMHYSPYIAAHKVVHAVGNLANPWFIEDGDLVFRQRAFSSFDDNTSEVFLPINLALSQINPNVTRMYVLIKQTVLLAASYKTTHSRHCYYDYPTMDAIEVSSTGQISPSRVTDGYEERWCDLFPQIETWSQDIPSYLSLYANGYKEVRIKKIWFTDLNT